MRTMQILLGLGLVPVLTANLHSQSVPYDTTIAVPEVEVRSGPSQQFYATSKLHQGARVRVVQEEPGGWLAIEPPPGSFSWINSRLVELDAHGRTAMVVVPEAPVRPGSALVDREPDVERVKLARGTQVLIKGQAKIGQDGTKWYPIEPQKELRYIPKDAVKAVPPVENLTTQASPLSGTAHSAAGGTATPSNQLWLQAEKARETGNLAEARRLYELCAQQPGIDYDLQVRCYNRLQTLKNGVQGSVLPGYQPGRSSEAITGAPPAAISPYPSPGTGVPNSSGTQAVGYGPQRPANPLPDANARSIPGRLRRAGFFVDGKQAYVLEDSAGRPHLYVTAQPGLNLEQYLNRVVTLAGPTVYRGDLRANYMTAVQAWPLP